MDSLSRWIKEHALVAFFILAYGFTWALFPLVAISPLMGILGLFGPAFAALVVTGVRDGREGVRRLVGRLGLFRVEPAWYLVTLGLPVLLSAIIVGLSLLIATLFHGAYNTFALVNPSLDPASRWWLYALVYLGAGLVVFLAAGPDLNRRLAIRRKKFA